MFPRLKRQNDEIMMTENSLIKRKMNLGSFGFFNFNKSKPPSRETRSFTKGAEPWFKKYLIIANLSTTTGAADYPGGTQEKNIVENYSTWSDESVINLFQQRKYRQDDR